MELNRTKHSVVSNVTEATTFQITKTELHVPVITLKTDHNNKLNQLLETGFERFVNWNEFKTILQTITQAQNDNSFKRILLDSAYPEVNRLFVVGFDNDLQRKGHQRYFLRRTDIIDCKVLIDGRNFYDQNVNYEIKKYEELRGVMIGKRKP